MKKQSLFFPHSHFQSHMSLDIQHRRSNIQPPLSPLSHLSRSCDDSHMLNVTLHILCYTLIQQNSLVIMKPVLSAGFIPLAEVCSRKMEEGKGYTQGRGCGYGPLSLAKEFEFVCSQRKFFMGSFTQLKCPMVTENELGQDAQTLKCNSFILLTTAQMKYTFQYRRTLL